LIKPLSGRGDGDRNKHGVKVGGNMNNSKILDSYLEENFFAPENILLMVRYR
jgi:hypothetical protein